MSDMEPEVRNFLAKITISLSVSVLWMLINSTFGIFFKYAFFEDKPTIGNYIFYIWFVISLGWLIYYLYKKWKF
ncbi:MAG: hypothetical protein H0W12_01420 [Chitinophagaceae bacterium]|nr:hypothetical protein [Chitinophagaceae bacterium]